MRILVMLTAACVMSAAEARAQTFDYFGDRGPSLWGELAPAWGTCSTGLEQSPVNFRLPVAAPRHQSLALEYGLTTGKIFNNGHTVEVETEGHNTLHFDGEYFELVQFHFHTPSEHRRDGRGFDMELHLVHRSLTGRLAVIGVLLVRGASSGPLGPVLDALPPDLNTRHELDFSIDPAAFLPRSRAHARYVGSLTTPPCREGVSWFVLEDVMTVSDEHLARFAQLVPFNARPVQREIR